MPNSQDELQIAERIARRRARTAELKKLRKRQLLIQSSVALLLLALTILLFVFLRNAIPHIRSNKKSSGEKEDNRIQVIQSDLSNNFHSASAASDIPSDPEVQSAPSPLTVAPELCENTVIVLDPGRGFSDLGCTSDFLDGINERDLTLTIAQQTADMLRHYGFCVTLTHESNEPPAEAEEGYILDQFARIELAKAAQCDYFLSLHCDSFQEDASVSGVTLHYCSDTEGSAVLADTLSAAFSDHGQAAPQMNAASSEDAFLVTSEVGVPSVLVELGYVTNANDAQLLCSTEGQNALASALADGVLSCFLKNLDASSAQS